MDSFVFGILWYLTVVFVMMKKTNVNVLSICLYQENGMYYIISHLIFTIIL